MGKEAAWWRSALAKCFSVSEVLSPGDNLRGTVTVLKLKVSIRSGNVDRERLCEVAA